MITINTMLSGSPLHGAVTINVFGDFYVDDEINFYANLTGSNVTWVDSEVYTGCELSSDFKFRDGEWLLDELGIFVPSTNDRAAWSRRIDTQVIRDEDISKQDQRIVEHLLKSIRSAGRPETLKKLRDGVIKDRVDVYASRIITLENEISALARKLTRYQDMLHG
jgi:hypothetical protein